MGQRGYFGQQWDANLFTFCQKFNRMSRFRRASDIGDRHAIIFYQASGGLRSDLRQPTAAAPVSQSVSDTPSFFACAATRSAFPVLLSDDRPSASVVVGRYGIVQSL